MKKFYKNLHELFNLLSFFCCYKLFFSFLLALLLNMTCRPKITGDTMVYFNLNITVIFNGQAQQYKLAFTFKKSCLKGTLLEHFLISAFLKDNVNDILLDFYLIFMIYQNSVFFLIIL